VTIDVDGGNVSVTVDGATHALTSGTGATWRGVLLEQPGPVQREYQVDGSDTTSTNDRQPQVIRDLQDTVLYRVDAWLRDEPSFSRWERLRLLDPTTGQPIPTRVVESDTPAAHRTEVDFQAAPAAAPPPDAVRSTVLPQAVAPLGAFRVEAALRRPEAAARLWLLSTQPGQQEGLELDRDRRNARWLILRGSVGEQPLPRWFFPEQPLPFVANLLHLLGRTTAAGFAVALAAYAIGLAVRSARRADANTAAGTTAPRPPPLSISSGRHANRHAADEKRHADRHTRHKLRAVTEIRPADIALAGWALLAAAVAARVYHQLPHILDAVSYTFQAGVLSTRQLWIPPPPLEAAFKGPFQVIANGRWFSQYPPGAPAAYALGSLVGLGWVVGTLACVVLIGASAWSAGAVFGRTAGTATLIVGLLSPFVLFQAGSFLSHPIAGGVLAGALAAYVQGERTGRMRWFGLSGALLGAGFMTREVASALFALPLLARAIAGRRLTALGWIAACGLPFALLYLGYNAALTGSPWQLPRSLFDASDRFGFGDDIGFHHRHTLAAGLANTDELLTLLQFDLVGWPPLFALGLVVLPFLLARPTSWDLTAAFGVLAFVAAYTAYFYHGIALGPRYYFEALPWLLLLAGRGVQRLIEVAGSTLAVALLLGALCLNTVLFYVPAALERRMGYSGFPDARPLTLSFVRVGLFGPRLENVPTPALVLTSDWWLFNAGLSALNCPRIPDCPALFALATTPQDEERLRTTYPGRTVLHAVNHDGRVDLEPAG
jgi:hypothetical protein